MSATGPRAAGRLDWSGAWGGGARRPCTYCGNGAFFLHPVLRDADRRPLPSHRVCGDEKWPGVLAARAKLADKARQDAAIERAVAQYADGGAR